MIQGLHLHSWIVIFFSLLSTTPPRPDPTPRDRPKTDPKWTETDPKCAETDPKRTETDQDQAFWEGGGVVGVGGWGGCKGKRKSLLLNHCLNSVSHSYSYTYTSTTFLHKICNQVDHYRVDYPQKFGTQTIPLLAQNFWIYRNMI